MILKASTRGGGAQLATHLLRTDENDHVTVHELRGYVSSDIHGAMKEAFAVCKGTRCKQYLFSLSLNPPPDQTPSIEEFEDAIGRVEERTGLSGQPRIVVLHEKLGRIHAHAVWSRINAEEMKAIQLSHWKLKLRDLSREIFLEHDHWKLPPGLMNSAERDPRNYSLKEYQEAKRKGASARELQDTIRECWQASDSKQAFEQSLKARGLVLARGDRRAHVVVTPDGQVLGIARPTGKRVKEIRARLGEPDDADRGADLRHECRSP